MRIEHCLFLKTNEMLEILKKEILDTNPDENLFTVDLDETYVIDVDSTKDYTISTISIAYRELGNGEIHRAPAFVHSDIGRVRLTVDIPFTDDEEPSLNQVIMAFVFRQKFS